MGGLTLTAFGGIVAVGVAGSNSWILPPWLRWGMGAPLTVGGNGVAWLGVAAVGVPHFL